MYSRRTGESLAIDRAESREDRDFGYLVHRPIRTHTTAHRCSLASFKLLAPDPHEHNDVITGIGESPTSTDGLNSAQDQST